MAINEAKLQEFVGKAVQDIGATQSAALVVIGDQLGLYKAMAGAGPLTPAEIAQRTGTVERYVREWLVNQAAGGYVEYNAETGRYSLGEEQALALANEDSPSFLPGAFQLALGFTRTMSKVKDAFLQGGGLRYEECDPNVHEGINRFFQPGYKANLVKRWVPSLEGIEVKLQSGARVADVGCGFGSATILLALAFPKSRFFGFDTHEPSIQAATRAAHEAGVGERVFFQLGSSVDFPGWDFDLVTFFDCLHDMANPIAAARRVRSGLAKDGTWMIVEPRAGDRVEENFNPVGRVYSSASVLHCLSVSLASGGAGLGTIAGEAKIREVVEAGGFTRFRRAAETPFNLVFEARL
jgi:SAM-dependent methyltransferase